MSQNPNHVKELEDAFIKVTFEDDADPAPTPASDDPLHDNWIDQGMSSTKRTTCA